MDETIKASPLKGLPRRSKRSTEHRVCSAEGCSTVLSSYNLGDRCWSHREMKVPRLRGRKTKE